MTDRWGRFVNDFVEQQGGERASYLRFHERRYVRTLEYIEEYAPRDRSASLELGTVGLFSVALKNFLEFQRCDVTLFESRSRDVVMPVRYRYNDQQFEFKGFNVDLERAPIPSGSDVYSYILCFELIEHMAIDPMFMLSELNRVCKLGGRLIVTTPNITASRRLKYILEGWHPHYFCAYNKIGSSDRHNLEYSPQLLKVAIEAAGFEIKILTSEDLFHDPVPEVIELLSRNGFPTNNRGDDLICIAEKVGGVSERFPEMLYA